MSGRGDDDLLESLQQALGHRFSDESHLRLALTHKSHAAEAGNAELSYERLEFLGDAVLQLAVTEYLYEAYPDLAEGEMAKVRAAVVDAPTLAALARSFGVGPALKLGKGGVADREGGRRIRSWPTSSRPSSGRCISTRVSRPQRGSCCAIGRRPSTAGAAAPGRRDYKTRLQERLAAVGLQPHYTVTDDGPEHAKTFSASVSDGTRVLGSGEGTSKKRAEQDAARDAARRLAREDA